MLPLILLLACVFFLWGAQAAAKTGLVALAILIGVPVLVVVAFAVIAAVAVLLGR